MDPRYCSNEDRMLIFPNMAGRQGIDDALMAELEEAGIEVREIPHTHPEVKTDIMGLLHGWQFIRNWYYWGAKGPGLPPEYADRLYTDYGDEVRVEGHTGGPSPREYLKGFCCGFYHVDTQRGLNALAETLRAVTSAAHPGLSDAGDQNA